MDIFKTVSGMMGGGGQSSESPVMAIIQMLSNRPGGLGGLVQQFQQAGLGDVVGSWVSTGQNLPISHEQMGSVLGNDQISDLAKQLGTDHAGAHSQLTELLPQIIDKLSPQGSLPQGNDWMSTAGGLLSSLMK